MPETGGDVGDGIAELGSNDIEDILDFDQLAKQLIEDASEDANESDTVGDPPHSPLTICLSLQAIQSALQETPPAQSATTKIPLESLFIFPDDPSAPLEMEYFWRGGIQNLSEEMEVHDMLCSSQESAREMDSDTSNIIPIAGTCTSG
ncbi:hypothetical protein BJY52DRAFT_1395373 [Lactarius psammicola]|nr:hypothetical protein BJY52DRAFT_1395373 [Lactarius psammicola]